MCSWTSTFFYGFAPDCLCRLDVVGLDVVCLRLPSQPKAGTVRGTVGAGMKPT